MSELSELKGQLLIAVPQLPDENFFRTVVLVLKHDDEGALGLILNRPTGVSLKDIWHQISGTTTDLDEALYFGGPVEGPLMALHCSFSIAEEDVLPGVFFSLRREQLDRLIDEQKSPLRIFVGHSGWGPGQLEAEIEAGGWLVSPARYEHVFEPPEELWKSVCEQFGNDILMSHRFRTLIPDDPSLN